MSIKITSQVWEHSDVKGGSLLVLLALADNANDEGFCWPHVTTIAAKARLQERQTYNVLNNLEDLGYITREARGRESVYYVHPKRSPENIAPDPNDHMQSVTRSHAIHDNDHMQSAHLYKEEPSVKEPSEQEDPPTPHGGKSGSSRTSNYDYDSDQDFVTFWDTYPLKKSKGQAFKAWRAARRRGVQPDVMIEAARRYRNQPNRNPDYTKHAATWINAEDYNDLETAVTPIPQGGGWWDN